MSDNGQSTEVKRANTRARNRWIVWGLVGLVVVVAALGVWIAVRGLQAKSELEAAQGLFDELQSQAVAFDVYGAEATLDEIAEHTDNAIGLTSDPIWRAGEMVPVAGTNLTAFRELAALTGDVIDRVASPLLGAADGISPQTLAPTAGVIDLGPLIAAAPAIEAASEGAYDALRDVEAIDTSTTVGQLDSARARIADLLTSVTPVLARLDATVPLMPAMLGSDGPRTYIVMFQNPAESRALGGAALSFAVLRVANGRIDLDSTATAALDFRTYDEPVMAMPDGVSEVHGGSYATSIADATLRPSFASAAQITREIWFRQFGYWIDGVISIDPVALSYVVGATEPIVLSTGDVLTRDSLVPLLLNGVYERYDTPDRSENNTAQDAVYAEAVSATFTRLTSGLIDPAALAEALMQGWDENRLLFWSADPDEQAQLAEVGLRGEPPLSDDATARVGVYFQDNSGSKMNYYLQQTVHLAQNTCRTDGRESYRVTVDLRSDVDPAAAGSLAASIVGNWESEGVVRGDQRVVVMLYAPPGSTIASRAVNGAAVGMDALHDATHPVSKAVVTIPPGAVSTVSFDIVAAEPGPKALEALITPMVNPTTVLDEVLDCATVAAE